MLDPVKCVWCKVEFTPRDYRQRACCQLHSRRAYARLPITKEKARRRYSAARRTRNRKRATNVTVALKQAVAGPLLLAQRAICVVCQAPFHSRKSYQLYCGKHCRDRAGDRRRQPKQRRIEYMRQYQLANRDKIKQQAQTYRLANRDKIRERKREYQLANRDKIREYKRKYRATNRDKVS